MKMDVNSGIRYSKLKHGMALETVGGGGGHCGNMSQKRAWICQSFLKIQMNSSDQNKMDHRCLLRA
jgi:hypothetical protein